MAQIVQGGQVQGGSAKVDVGAGIRQLTEMFLQDQRSKDALKEQGRQADALLAENQRQYDLDRDKLLAVQGYNVISDQFNVLASQLGEESAAKSPEGKQLLVAMGRATKRLSGIEDLDENLFANYLANNPTARGRMKELYNKSIVHEWTATYGQTTAPATKDDLAKVVTDLVSGTGTGTPKSETKSTPAPAGPVPTTADYEAPTVRGDVPKIIEQESLGMGPTRVLVPGEVPASPEYMNLDQLYALKNELMSKPVVGGAGATGAIKQREDDIAKIERLIELAKSDPNAAMAPSALNKQIVSTGAPATGAPRPVATVPATSVAAPAGTAVATPAPAPAGTAPIGNPSAVDVRAAAAAALSKGAPTGAQPIVDRYSELTQAISPEAEPTILGKDGNSISKEDAHRWAATFGPNALRRSLTTDDLAIVEPTAAQAAAQEKSFKIDMMKLAGSTVSAENELAVTKQIENARLQFQRDVTNGTIGGKEANSIGIKLLEAIKATDGAIKEKNEQFKQFIDTKASTNSRIKSYQTLVKRTQTEGDVLYDPEYLTLLKLRQAYYQQLAGVTLDEGAIAFVFGENANNVAQTSDIGYKQLVEALGVLGGTVK